MQQDPLALTCAPISFVMGTGLISTAFSEDGLGPPMQMNHDGLQPRRIGIMHPDCSWPGGQITSPLTHP